MDSQSSGGKPPLYSIILGTFERSISTVATTSPADNTAPSVLVNPHYVLYLAVSDELFFLYQEILN